MEELMEQEFERQWKLCLPLINRGTTDVKKDARVLSEWKNNIRLMFERLLQFAENIEENGEKITK